MSVYRTVQTGPNTTFGGFQNALSALAYQPSTFWMVARLPNAATANEIARNAIRTSAERSAEGGAGWVGTVSDVVVMRRESGP